MRKIIRNFLQTLPVLLVSMPVFAETAKTASKDISSGYGMVAIAAALCIGIAAFGGALGQGKAAAAALEGISRNPGAEGKVFKPLILGLALIESLVIYALLIAFFIIAKI
jgi:F-type H+-transporting ATPase subunit c